MFHNLTANPAAPAGESAWRRMLFVAVALVALSIAIRSINHDEGQYVAAIALIRNGLPYRDFAYLQTPLQPLLFAPLTVIPAGWLLVAMRIANGALAIATICLVRRALKDRVQPKNLLIALGVLICSEPFLFAASLARNDALPMALLAGAIAALLRGLDEHGRQSSFALAGLLLGLATSAKINAAIPAAGAGLFMLLRARQTGIRPILGFFAGGLAGLLPSLVLAAAAPQQFMFGVFTYSLEAPAQWWTSVGRADMLSWRGIPRLVGLAGRGVVLVGLIAAAADRKRSDDRRLLDLMIIGGAIGAYLPQPPFTQYLVPLIPPLGVRFGLALESARQSYWRVLVALGVAASVLGLAETAKYVARLPDRGFELAQTVRQGAAVAMLARGQPIVSLSPERIAGFNTNLDSRFVTGPFLFRTSGALSAAALKYGYSPNWRRIDQALDTRPPAAILVGGESRAYPPIQPFGLDRPLVAWALARGYAPLPLPGRGFTLFVRSPKNPLKGLTAGASTAIPSLARGSRRP